MQIVIDTREKRPWTFERQKGIERIHIGTLHSGDYSLVGFQANGIAIERKSLSDLFGSMTAGRVRFYNELRRLGGFGLAALIVEAGEDEILLGSRMTRVNPARMLRTLYAWCARFNIQVHFCFDKWEAQDKAHKLMRAYSDARNLKDF